MTDTTDTKRKKRKQAVIDPEAIYARFNACSSGRKPPQARDEDGDDDDGDDE